MGGCSPTTPEEIVALADRVRWDVAHADTATPELRVLATAAFAEHAAGRLLDVFDRWAPHASVDVVVEAAADVAALLRDRAYDIALGARPSKEADATMDVVPFLRYQRIIVASASHPLHGLPARSPSPSSSPTGGSPVRPESRSSPRRADGSPASPEFRTSWS